MLAYALRRFCLIIPTLLGILTVNFFLIQMAPGGPVEQFIARLEGGGDVFMERAGAGAADAGIGGAQAGFADQGYSGAQGLPEETLQVIRRMYGFDKPILVRYVDMLGDFLTFRLGDSLFRAGSVVDLIREALPVSITLGVWSTLIIYMVSIPLGIARAVRRGTVFDAVSGFAVVVAGAVPGFLFAVLLIVLFAGGSYFKIFPLRGLHSPDYELMSFWMQTLDYLHHITLPVIAMSIGGFAGLTLLTRNAFLDELSKQYVETARAKGLTERAVLYGHVFRNAMLIIISGLPSTFVRMFFAGSLLIETIFSLNGLGLLGFEAAMQRDYPVMFASLYVFTLIGLFCSVLGDLSMMLIDPRIDFSDRSRT
ncbi:MAG: microcin C ABC transporter permease YejB [Desulfovibrio sp.]|nr:microcin C ABC transporter permease YejB [Desulfovibrio sp.]